MGGVEGWWGSAHEVDNVSNPAQQLGEGVEAADEHGQDVADAA